LDREESQEEENEKREMGKVTIPEAALKGTSTMPAISMAIRK
jgi:hypothetical protein